MTYLELVALAREACKNWQTAREIQKRTESLMKYYNVRTTPTTLHNIANGVHKTVRGDLADAIIDEAQYEYKEERRLKT